MPRIPYAGIAAVMTVLLLTTPLQAQPGDAPKPVSKKEEIATLQQQSKEAFEAEKWVAYYVANMKLSKLSPYESEYLVNIVRACALLDRKSTAYHYMLKMQKQGLSYDFNSTDDTLKIRNTEAYGYINDLLISAGQPSGVGTAAFTLQGSPADFRAIAWDGSRDRLLVGTMSKGAVIAVSAEGETEVLLEANDENGLWSIGGLAVDAGRKRLWVSSVATPSFGGFSPEDKNHGSLFEFDLDTLEQVGRFNLPVDGMEHELGSVAVTDDGLVYVIDRMTSIVYRKVPEGDRLEAFFAGLDLHALSDIAVVPDNSRVFVSDTEMGILAIDPNGEKAVLLSGPETINFGGIEGIEYHDGQLFIVQGGLEPQRVIRLELDPGGATVQSVSPMASALDEFSQPGLGAIQGGNLYYFANSGAQEAANVMVMRTPLDAGSEVAPPDVSQFKQAIEARQQ
jgi:hypothetical protein